MPDDRAIVQELMGRLDSLPSDKKSVVMELGSRLGVGPTPAKVPTPAALQRDPGVSVEQFNRSENYPDNPYQKTAHAPWNKQGMDESTALLSALPFSNAVSAAPGKFWSTLATTGKNVAVGTSTAALAGFAAHKAARGVGLPEWAADTIGTIAAVYGASKGSEAIEYWQKAESPSISKFMQWLARGKPTLTPKAPGKGTGTKYGGTKEPDFSPPSKPVKTGKFTPPEPEAPKPYAPKATVKRSMGKTATNPTTEEGIPGTILKRGKFTPPEESATPTKPGKGTGTKYGGNPGSTASERGGAASGRSPSPKGRMTPPRGATKGTEMPEAQYDPNKSPSWNEANKALHIAAKQMGATHETIHDAYTSATGKTSLADASRGELIKMYEALTKTKFKSSISPSGASKARPFARQ